MEFAQLRTPQQENCRDFRSRQATLGGMVRFSGIDALDIRATHSVHRPQAVALCWQQLARRNPPWLRPAARWGPVSQPRHGTSRQEDSYLDTAQLAWAGRVPATSGSYI